MKDDELLARAELTLGSYISKYYGSNKDLELRSNVIDSLQALRAVMELHTAGNGEASRCEACYMGFDCPTIQAIEKELK